MDAQHERRHSTDRREFAVYYRYGNERRDNSENRRMEMVEDSAIIANGVITGGYWGSSGSIVEITKEIAAAFGLSPASLEMIEHDDLISDTEHCYLCADRDRKYAELEVELAHSRKELERYRNQVSDLLLSLNISRQ